MKKNTEDSSGLGQDEVEEEVDRILLELDEKFGREKLIHILGFALTVAVDNTASSLDEASAMLDKLYDASWKYIIGQHPECQVAQLDVSGSDGKIDFGSVTYPTTLEGEPLDKDVAARMHQELASGEKTVVFSSQTRRAMVENGVSEDDIRDMLIQSLRKTMQ